MIIYVAISKTINAKLLLFICKHRYCYYEAVKLIVDLLT